MPYHYKYLCFGLQLFFYIQLACVMEDASICGLGQAAPNPLRCVMKYFPDEVSGG